MSFLSVSKLHKTGRQAGSGKTFHVYNQESVSCERDMLELSVG